MTGFIETHQALCVAFHAVFGKNEASIGGLPRNSFVFMEFEQGGSVSEVAALAVAAVGLDLAELVEGFLKLAREALALDGEVVDQAMGVDDVEVD
ncbi:MAG TPA: hypothetical protein VEV17_18620, partial [Bryobacteraceae bacterium]|nr:hypothetical protein [Bryobacteraceae bacterium]